MASNALPLVSVIVPTKNSGEFLEACLKSIKAQTYKNIEIIVVDNFSTDPTPTIAKKYADKFYQQGPERSAQRNYGVSKCNGDYVAIIDSDMVLTTKVIQACIDAVTSSNNIKGVIIPEESFGIGFWAQCKRLERSFYVGVNWMEAARFFDKNTFHDFQGYDESNTGTEDYDLPQRVVHKLGAESLSRITYYIRHNELRLGLLRTCKKKYYYAKRINTYRSKEANRAIFKIQSNPVRRYLLFFSHPLMLFKNPIVGLGMLLLKTAEYLFGFFGYLSSKLGNKELPHAK